MFELHPYSRWPFSVVCVLSRALSKSEGSLWGGDLVAMTLR